MIARIVANTYTHVYQEQKEHTNIRRQDTVRSAGKHSHIDAIMQIICLKHR